MKRNRRPPRQSPIKNISIRPNSISNTAKTGFTRTIRKNAARLVGTPTEASQNSHFSTLFNEHVACHGRTTASARRLYGCIEEKSDQAVPERTRVGQTATG